MTVNLSMLNAFSPYSWVHYPTTIYVYLKSTMCKQHFIVISVILNIDKLKEISPYTAVFINHLFQV